MTDRKRGEREPAGGQAPPLPDPPQRHEQDTEPVSGEAVLHPPAEAELVQRSRVQG